MSAWLARLLPAVFLIGLAAVPASAAEAPKVKDEGKLFTEHAEKEANDIIADTKRRFNKEVHVEAYGKPPEGKAVRAEEAGSCLARPVLQDLGRGTDAVDRHERGVCPHLPG
jgi:hypothetical protein